MNRKSLEGSERGTEKVTLHDNDHRGKSRQDQLEVIAVVQMKDGSLAQHGGKGGGEK